MSTLTLDRYTLADLEALEQEHPEFGRIEIVHGWLHAGGVDVTGDRHQAVTLAVLLALVAACPADHVVRMDTYWVSGDGWLRPDVAVWRSVDRPADGGAFRVPPVAVIEVLSKEADHDLVRKARVCAAHGVPAWFIDPQERDGWWLSSGSDHVTSDETTITLPAWAPITLAKSVLSQ